MTLCGAGKEVRDHREDFKPLRDQGGTRWIGRTTPAGKRKSGKELGNRRRYAVGEVDVTAVALGVRRRNGLHHASC